MSPFGWVIVYEINLNTKLIVTYYSLTVSIANNRIAVYYSRRNRFVVNNYSHRIKLICNIFLICLIITLVYL